MIFYANESWTFVLYIRTNNYTLKNYTSRFFTQNVAKDQQFLVLSVRCTTFHNCTWTKFKNLEVFKNSPEVCCGNKIHNLILNIYDHGTQKCRIARSSLFSDDTILKVNEILTTALLKAPWGFPLSRFKAHCDQWHRILTNSYKNSELTWAVDTTHMKIYSKYFKQFIIGEPITRASDILPFLKAFLCNSRTY